AQTKMTLKFASRTTPSPCRASARSRKKRKRKTSALLERQHGSFPAHAQLPPQWIPPGERPLGQGRPEHKSRQAAFLRQIHILSAGKHALPANRNYRETPKGPINVCRCLG